MMDRIKEHLEKAMSTLGFLRMSTPKIKNNHRLTLSEIEEQKKNIENTPSPGPAGPIVTRPISNWTGNNLDPDSVKRHYMNLKRAGFKDNAHAKGMF